MAAHVRVEATWLRMCDWRLCDCICVSGGYVTAHVWYNTHGGYMTAHV